METHSDIHWPANANDSNSQNMMADFWNPLWSRNIQNLLYGCLQPAPLEEPAEGELSVAWKMWRPHRYHPDLPNWAAQTHPGTWPNSNECYDDSINRSRHEQDEC